MRSMFACILKAFGVCLVYSAWISGLYAYLLSSSMAPLYESLGQETSIAQKAVSLTMPIGSLLFGCVLIFLAHPLSCLLFRKEENDQPAPIVTADLLLVGIGLVSIWFLYSILPAAVEELWNAAQAHQVDLASPRFAARALQLLLIVLVLLFRQPISRWCSKIA